MKESRRISARAHALRNTTTVVCALLFYYCVPLGFELGDDWPVKVVGLVAFVTGVVGLIWMTWQRVGRYVADPEATSGRVDGVLFALCVAVMFFALFYYILELRNPSQFGGLSTRTDALYYTIVTLGTVGYGDVQAVGQAARVATMVQVAFDLVVIGTLVAVVNTSITRRVEAADVRNTQRD
ncbi:potassium channel family protein [Nocardia sp. GCM10030253]|uniref:potassium channel family protein n=1 Tax=Nocardia sp. GCM10030253 TaxID=3273404 RepID=UPI00364134EF